MSHNIAKESLTSKGVNRRQFITRTAMGAGALVLSTTIKGFGERGASQCSPEAWKFGVMADTQWTVADDLNDPNSSAIGIANQIQQQLINAGVKFVVHVGDLCDNGSIAGEDTRALYAQSLYNAGIGFFPLRGNHDDGAASAAEFKRVYPQTQNGIHDTTPSDVRNLTLPAADLANQPRPANTRSPFKVGSGFSSPDPWGTGDLAGLSYAFEFNNARFILLDQFTPTDSNANYNSSTTIGAQQYWIEQQLEARDPRRHHAFVFSHKGLITCNHVDVLFGSDPSQNPNLVDAFISSLARHNADYFIHGHDHMYDRSLISDTTGESSVQQILCASNSSKFYVPAGSSTNLPAGQGTLSNDQRYDVPAFGRTRRLPISQELNIGKGTQAAPTPRDIGYYIFTVDGETVTVDYYAVTVPVVYLSGSETIINNVQPYRFTLRETFGRSLNGEQFVVASGKPYTQVKDRACDGTEVRILAGNNLSTATDANGILLSKVVSTGWTSRTHGVASDILSLQGLGSLSNANAHQTDTYVLELTHAEGLCHLAKGKHGLVAQDSNGEWVNAVELNFGGKAKFVNGGWNSSYPLGYYGVSGDKAWAVVNFQGKFAIAK